MIRSPRTRLCVAGAAATAILGAVIVPLTAMSASADTEPVAAPLAAPTGLTPDDCLTSDPTTTDTFAGCQANLPHPARKSVRLDWAPVRGATGYRVEVGTDTSWSDDPTYSVDIVSSEVTLPVWLPHATYVWRVAALQGSALGHWTSESGQTQPEPQFTRGWRDRVTLTPVTTFQGRPTYAWTPVAGASGYDLQVSTDPNFGAADPIPAGTASPDTTSSPQTQTQAKYALHNCLTPRTRVTPSLNRIGDEGSVGNCVFQAPPDGTTVYWRVRPLDAFVGSEQPVDTTPASKGGVSYVPPSQDVTSDCPSDPAASASSIPSVSASASASASATPGAPQTGGCGDPSAPSEKGSWSAISSFTYTTNSVGGAYNRNAVISTASLGSDPDAVCSVSNPGAPDAEKATCKDFPTLRWPAASGAVAYRIYVGLDDQFSNIQAIVETPALEWTPVKSWRDSAPSTSYYYAVQACNDTECGAVTNTPPSFRKVTPRLALGGKPAARGDFRLSWTSYANAIQAATGKATQDAFAYHLQVATADHASYDATLDDVMVDETSYVAPDKVYGDGSFVWRVQAVDSAGHKLPWSLSQSFVRDNTPPRATSAAPSSKVGVKQPITVTFSEPVSGVSASSLTLSPVTGFRVDLLSSTQARLTPTTPFAPGSTFRMLLGSGITDAAGNVAVNAGPAFTVATNIDDNSPASTYSGAWRRAASSNAVGGSYVSSNPVPRAQTSVTMAFRGVGVVVAGCRAPAGGYADVYVDGVRKARVSTYRSYSGCGVRLASIQGLARGLHTVKVVGIGMHQTAANANAVGLDGFTVTP